MQYGHQLSLAYQLERHPDDTDVSHAKIVYAYLLGDGLSINANADVSVNNELTKPDGTSRSRLHAFDAELAVNIPTPAALDGLTIGAKVERLKDTSKTTVSAQAKTSLHLTDSLQVPIALTYRNRTETSDESGVRLNIGLAVNADHLLGSLARPAP
jgi:hypothetical protein